MVEANSVSYYEQGEYEDSNPGLKFGLIFGLIILIAGLGVLGFFFKAKGFGSGASSFKYAPYCESYLNAVQRGRYREAYAMIAPEWQEKQSGKQFRNFHSSLRDIIGTMYSKKIISEEEKDSSNGKMVVVVYLADFTQAEQTRITFTLFNKGGTWKVAGANYQNPKLMQFFPCPECGTLRNIMKKQCPKCAAMGQ